MSNEAYKELMKESSYQIEIKRYDFEGIPVKPLNPKGIYLFNSAGLLEPLIRILGSLKLVDLESKLIQLASNLVSAASIFRYSVWICIIQEDKEEFEKLSNFNQKEYLDLLEYIDVHSELFFKVLCEKKQITLSEIYKKHFNKFLEEWVLFPLSKEFRSLPSMAELLTEDLKKTLEKMKTNKEVKKAETELTSVLNNSSNTMKKSQTKKHKKK